MKKSNKMSEKLFIPVSLKMLPEYLSSGFIGLPASRDPSSDIQSDIFGRVMAVEEPSVYQAGAYFELESVTEDLRTVGRKSDQTEEGHSPILELDGPVSMAKVKRILFSDLNEKENFVASYSMLPDLPLDMFEFDVVIPNMEDVLEVAPAPKMKATTNVKKTRLVNKMHQASSLVVGVREAVQTISSKVNYQGEVLVKAATPKKIVISVVRSIIDASGLAGDTPKAMFTLLEVYCSAVDQLCGVGKIEIPLLVSKMTEIADEKESASRDDGYSLVKRFLDKARHIQMGMEKPPELKDEASLVLQRAIYLAITVDDIDAICAVRQNFKVEPIVEGLARLLTTYRASISYVSGKYWRGTRSDYDAVLSAAETIGRERNLHLRVGFSPSDEPDKFGYKQQAWINHILVTQRYVEPPAQLLVVIAHLKALHQDVRPGEVGRVTVKYDLDGRNVLLTLNITTSDVTGKNYVRVAGTVINGYGLFGKKKSRDICLEQANFYMVCVNPKSDGTGGMEVSRSQLVETMDHDELSDHLELVAKATLGLQELVLSGDEAA